ncbi:putative beta-lysine N-acetyltransferase [Priestia koreensis]|uniref:putative beta-lysine N-acetyltransferase n=1 Tax=Priestia koreensis TaxID=284581 RepID=UPI0034583815
MNTDVFYEKRIMNTSPCYIEYVCDHFNKRLRIDDYRGNVLLVIEEMLKEREKHQYEKLIFKSKFEHISSFISNGFQLEALIPDYFNGSTAYFMTQYFETARHQTEKWIEEDQIIQSVKRLPLSLDLIALSSSYVKGFATVDDANELASLYQTVFEIYPAPLHHPNYVKGLLEEGAVFAIIRHNNRIISAASAEVNETYHNAELTDCATLPEYRKHGLMKHLLVALEENLASRQIFCVYTIARSLSFGMNAAFYQLGYEYYGRLTNNCFIFDKLEDMNVWTKNLA